VHIIALTHRLPKYTFPGMLNLLKMFSFLVISLLLSLVLHYIILLLGFHRHFTFPSCLQYHHSLRHLQLKPGNNLPVPFACHHTCLPPLSFHQHPILLHFHLTRLLQSLPHQHLILHSLPPPTTSHHRSLSHNQLTP
jgi:hypothetical protein